jgi:hypothetical protein
MSIHDPNHSPGDAKGQRDVIIVLSTAAAIAFVAVVGVGGWFAYEERADQEMVDHVIAHQEFYGEHVNSPDELREALRDLQDNLGASRHDARAVISVIFEMRDVTEAQKKGLAEGAFAQASREGLDPGEFAARLSRSLGD